MPRNAENKTRAVKAQDVEDYIISRFAPFEGLGDLSIDELLR